MTAPHAALCAGLLRRARPWLGTLVEVAAAPPAGVGQGAAPSATQVAVEQAFDAIAQVQRCLSRFDPASDVAHFAALPAGASLAARSHTVAVLQLAAQLQRDSAGLFDISLGSGADAWTCDGARLHKHATGVRLDLGGIGKGYAVDQAVAALQAAGVPAGWVNAGGDLRVFGPVELPVSLRDEVGGGVRPFLSLGDAALATSRFGAGSRARLSRPGGAPAGPDRHVSVAAPSCLWADALTKIVAASGDVAHPVLARAGAQAWLH